MKTFKKFTRGIPLALVLFLTAYAPKSISWRITGGSNVLREGVTIDSCNQKEKRLYENILSVCVYD